MANANGMVANSNFSSVENRSRSSIVCEDRGDILTFFLSKDTETSAIHFWTVKNFDHCSTCSCKTTCYGF